MLESSSFPCAGVAGLPGAGCCLEAGVMHAGNRIVIQGPRAAVLARAVEAAALELLGTPLSAVPAEAPLPEDRERTLDPQVLAAAIAAGTALVLGLPAFLTGASDLLARREKARQVRALVARLTELCAEEPGHTLLLVSPEDGQVVDLLSTDPAVLLELGAPRR